MSKEKVIATPNFDRINPSTCVNGKLRKLHRLLNAAYMGKFRAFGLKGSMVSILFIIGKIPGVNQKFIADRLVLDQSTMSRDLKKLKDRGLISSQKGKDPRNTELSMTKEGFELMEQVAPIWEKLHHKVEEILGSFNLQQIDSITAALNNHVQELE